MEQKSPPTGINEPRDGNTVRLVSLPSRARTELVTLQQVRREMATLYDAAKRGDISSTELKGSIYALSQIAKLIEICSLEERMEALEIMATAGARAH